MCTLGPATLLADDWQYSGHVKYQAAINLYDATSIFGSGGNVAALDQDANLRLKAEKRNGSWDYKIHYEIGVLYGNTLEASRTLTLPFGSYGLPNDNNRLLNLTGTIYDEGRAAAVHRIDRASVGYAKNYFVFRAGVIMSQDKQNEIADRGFRIVGLYQAELEATETAYVFTGLKTAQKLLGMASEISEISLMTTSREGLDPLIDRLRVASPQLQSMSWQQLQPLIVSAMSVYDTFMVIWYLIIFAAMAFGLTNTMLMSVFERTRELGLFQALGMRPRFIVGHVMMESLILLIIGITLGNLAAWLTTVALADGIDMSAFARGMEQFHMASILYFKIEPRDLFNANSLVLVLGLLASLYPAWKAAHYVPVEAITRI